MLWSGPLLPRLPVTYVALALGMGDGGDEFPGRLERTPKCFRGQVGDVYIATIYIYIIYIYIYIKIFKFIINFTLLNKLIINIKYLINLNFKIYITYQVLKIKQCKHSQ
jgi:hypothetical protein